MPGTEVESGAGIRRRRCLASICERDQQGVPSGRTPPRGACSTSFSMRPHEANVQSLVPRLRARRPARALPVGVECLAIHPHTVKACDRRRRQALEFLPIRARVRGAGQVEPAMRCEIGGGLRTAGCAERPLERAHERLGCGQIDAWAERQPHLGALAGPHGHGRARRAPAAARQRPFERGGS